MGIISTYLLYLALSALLTIWVAQTLYKNGEAFLVEAFHGDAKIAHSVNHLLVVGFYLINLGYIALMIKSRIPTMAIDLFTTQMAIETLSQKLGFVSVILGGMHFFNLYVFAKIRSNARLSAELPPVAPEASV